MTSDNQDLSYSDQCFCPLFRRLFVYVYHMACGGFSVAHSELVATECLAMTAVLGEIDC